MFPRRLVFSTNFVFLLAFFFTLTGCAAKKQNSSLELLLQNKQQNLSQKSMYRSGEDKQMAALLKENAKIQSAMKGFRPSDSGYVVLAGALQENVTALSKLGYDDLPENKKSDLARQAGV